MFSQRARNCLFDIRIPNKTCVFFSFCFFVLFSMVRVHAKAGPWGRPHAAYPIGPFERTFFTLQKKPLLRDFTYLGLIQARPKTLPKKVQKNSFGGPSWAILPETVPKNEKVCNLQKLILLEGARIESGSMRGTLSGRRPRGNHRSVLWKNVFFWKKTWFFQSTTISGRPVPTSERPWGGRIGRASSTLCFFTKFLQKNTRPVARRDFRLATGKTLTWRILRD